MIIGAGENEKLIHFVGDNWQLVSVCDRNDFQNVFFAEDVAARVARLVDQNRPSLLIDQALHVLQVDVPTRFRDQVVRAKLYFVTGSPSRVVPGRSRDENVLAGVHQRQNCDLDRHRHAASQNHVVRINLPKVLRIISDRLASLQSSGAGIVRKCIFVRCITQRVDPLGMRLQVTESSRITGLQNNL